VPEIAVALHAPLPALCGDDDFFSNGIHLNVIQASVDPGAESFRNLHAIDDGVHDVIKTDSHLVIAALGGDAPFAPVGTREAVEIGLLDAAFGATLAEFRAMTRERARRVATGPDLGRLLEDKRRRRAREEQINQAYRTHELTRSHSSIFGADSTYHEARRRFVYKLGPACAVTPTAGGEVAQLRLR
jgi:putative two-component system hydrogenase maturation factor HypX/HoxX